MSRCLMIFLLVLGINVHGQEDVFKGKKVSFFSLDSLEITSDLYLTNDDNGTFILLFHQAGFSRGAYRTIAPKLNEMGYNCLAVDQRSGHKARGVLNETTKRAIAADKRIKFGDAVQDMEAALFYAKKVPNAKKIIIWGSSYSASGVLYLANKYPVLVKGVLSFSPGEYYTIEDKKIESYISNISCPVFITSAKSEEKQWRNFYDKISSPKSFFLPEEKGFHGSKALWSEKKGSEQYWEAVISFLNELE